MASFSGCDYPLGGPLVLPLLANLVNNLDHRAEGREHVLARVRERALQGNRTALSRAAKEYGVVRTRKFFNALAADAHAS